MSILDGKELHKLQHPEIVHEDGPGLWYFWEETWAHRQGPFSSKEAAQAACEKYAEQYLGSG